MYAFTEYAGSSYRLFRTQDGGATAWENISDLAPTCCNWNAIEVSPVTGDVLLSTSNGSYVIPPPYAQTGRLFDGMVQEGYLQNTAWEVPVEPPVETVTLNPVADAYVRGGTYANDNYGTATQIQIRTSTPDYQKEGFLKFDLADIALPVESATLRLHLSSGGNSTHSVRLVSDDSWTETGIKYSNKPSAGSIIASYPVTTTSGYIDIDVKSAVESEAGGLLTLHISDDNNNGISFTYHSKEGTNKPQLVTMSNVLKSATIDTPAKSESGFGKNVVVYPNPTRKLFTVNLGEVCPEINMQVSDSNGRMISSAQFRNEQFVEGSISGPSGVYFVTVMAGQKRKTLRVVKQ
jgi:hypothetical protein